MNDMMEYEKLKTIAKYPTGKLNSNAAVEGGQYPFFTCAHEIYSIDRYTYDGEYVLLGGNNANGDFPIYYYNGKFDAYQRTYLIQSKNPNYLTKYLYYAIQLRLKQMQSNASGTATKYLTLPILNGINIEKRCPDKQKLIIGILDKYDLLIENNNKRIKILEQMAEELYKEWFVRVRLPKKTEQDKCHIRKEWKIGKLSDIAKITGKSIKTETREVFDYYVPIDCIDSKSITLKRYEPISNAGSSLQSFKAGDILFGAMRPYFNKVCLAPFDGITRKTCFVINSIGLNYRNYVLLTLFQKNTIDFASTISIGSTMPYVGSFKDLGRLNIVIPDKKTIIEFNKIIDPILEMLAILSKKNENLVKQRDLLLPRLMSGKLKAK